MCMALTGGTYSVRERVLTRLQSVCVCFMCISEGVSRCMYMLGLDVVCVGGVRQGDTVQRRVRSVPGSVWMDVWGEGRLHSGAAVSARRSRGSLLTTRGIFSSVLGESSRQRLADLQSPREDYAIGLSSGS